MNVAWVVALRAFPEIEIYCNSKFGLRALNDALREEVAREKIAVILVCPGNTATEFSTARRPMATDGTTAIRFAS